jgi:hypothetical protein
MMNDHATRFALSRGGQGQALPLRLLTALLIVLLVFISVSSSALAQSRKRQPARASQDKKTASKNATERKSQPVDEVTKLRDEFVRLTGEYKKNLGDLLPYQERNVQQAEERLGKLQEIYKEGLVSKRDVDAADKSLADARAKLAETQQQMKAADAQIADALVEEKAVEQEAQAPPPPRGKMIRTTAYIRYSGAGAWSLATGAGRVENFYRQTFGKQLPISAFGQTAVHNSLGFDHRNAMDVALNPASAEGRALIAYLQSNSIPFFAFFVAIPGSATGPHIHVGMPSHRIASH